MARSRRVASTHCLDLAAFNLTGGRRCARVRYVSDPPGNLRVKPSPLDRTANLSLRQPGGQIDVSLTGSRFLHDTDSYNVNLFGSTNTGLFRDFSFRVSGSYAWVRDQLFLPAGDLYDEDILTRRQALSTGFEYFVSFGISCQFGSIFNNIVNLRFGSEEGRFFF